jgi:hypothetical protein
MRHFDYKLCDPQKQLLLPAGLSGLVLRLRGAYVYGLDVVDSTSARPKWLNVIGGRYVDGRQVPADRVEKTIGAMDLILDASGIAALEFNLLDSLGTEWGLCAYRYSRVWNCASRNSENYGGTLMKIYRLRGLHLRRRLRLLQRRPSGTLIIGRATVPRRRFQTLITAR